ncbi:hypothetical protein M422DRAFT_26807 [Sphaerobolus stellatus SS14]|nr:hypothetical protein M422DRAFT_26807 [Sphaerobolus stellatus SS14]
MASRILPGVRREIYSRKPDWWARYTWPLVGGVALWTAVGAENVYNRWVMRLDPAEEAEAAIPAPATTPTVKAPPAAAPAVSPPTLAKPESPATPTSTPLAPTPAFSTSPAPTTPPAPKYQWELRPWHQRALLSGTIFAFGTGLCIVFLTGRSRIIRRIHGVYVAGPSTPVPRAARGQATRGLGKAKEKEQSEALVHPKGKEELLCLVIETLASFGKAGDRVVNKGKFEVIPSTKNADELRIKVPNASGGDTLYWVGLTNARINGGEPEPADVVKPKLIEALGVTNSVYGRWKMRPLGDAKDMKDAKKDTKDTKKKKRA